MNPSLSTLFLVTLGSCSNVGWKSFLRENPTEFHDLPLTWHTKAHVPDWLSGTYVRNGPAQVRHFVIKEDKALTADIGSIIPRYI